MIEWQLWGGFSTRWTSRSGHESKGGLPLRIGGDADARAPTPLAFGRVRYAAVFNQASRCMFMQAITMNRKCFGPLRQVSECTL